MTKVSLALLIHSHQPVGNFDRVIEEAYQKSYLPFAETLLAHPRIRLSLHYSGVLLDWLEAHHPEYFEKLRQLVQGGRAELVGGGYYEPILPAIPDFDKKAQIRKLAEYLHHHFGLRPRGAWVAERVWEPSLAEPLAEAGVEYAVLDDTHFLAAGLEPHQLHGTYITEALGRALCLVPSLKALRYTIPFREPEETLQVLREGLNLPERLFAAGDDCEKFGVWPGTYDHCYKNKWLEKFFERLEASGDWLETITVADYLQAHPPLGRIYLPTASYAEMMEWALPPASAREFKACVEESERLTSAERFRRFLRGGLWQNFLAKYSESNQLHKFMLDLRRRWHEVRKAPPTGDESQALLAEAHTHLLAGQCNDAYWHGIFGGLYAPHLRSAVLQKLIRAESLLDQVEANPSNPGLSVQSRDFDADGQDEILVSNAHLGMVLRPSDGGTVSSLRFKPAGVELINSLMRRPEAYHESVRQKASAREAPGEGPASIHEQVWSKEPNLRELLRYDRYARQVFRTYLFPAGKQLEDYDHLRLDENRELAGGSWSLVGDDASRTKSFELEKEVTIPFDGTEHELSATKTIKSSTRKGAWRLECRSALSTEHGIPVPLALGLELVFNLLAGDAPDRYFQANQTRWPLEFKGEIDTPQLMLVDEWQGIKISLEAHPTPRWWIVPIETISQSESGFERVYQGSAILAVWKITPPWWRNVACMLSLEIARIE